jgi:prepilin-type N-terminal cleavage/methylation domain-containing protein
MDRRRGFTLVELLVVIAIIALLMSILMPALGRVRKQAKLVICQSQLKQWGSFFFMYADDNESSFMEGRGINPWWTALEPYYKNRALLCCPMANNPDLPAWPNNYHSGNFGTWPKEWFSDPKGGPNFYGSYGINEWVCNPDRPLFSEIGITEFQNSYWRNTQVTGGAYIPLLLDAWWDQGWAHSYDWIPDWPGQWEGTTGGDMAHFCHVRHGYYLNSLFMDYSVRKVSLKCLWNFKWHRVYDVSAPPPDFSEKDWIKKFPECD